MYQILAPLIRGLETETQALVVFAVTYAENADTQATLAKIFSELKIRLKSNLCKTKSKRKPVSNVFKIFAFNNAPQMTLNCSFGEKPKSVK